MRCKSLSCAEETLLHFFCTDREDVTRMALKESRAMASLQKKGDAFYCQFCYLGKRYTVTVGKVSEAEAEAFAGRTQNAAARA